MNNDFLKRRLQRVIRRHQWLGLWRKLAVWWALSALLGVALVYVQRSTGWVSPLALPLLAAVAVAVACGIAIKHFEKAPDYRWAAQQIENAHPELKGLLLTAVQQNILPGVEPSYLQHRVMQEAVARSQEQNWAHVVAPSRLAWTQVVHVAALIAFVFALSNIKVASPVIKGSKPVEMAWIGADGVSVTPGDTSIERGESLVVLARFGKALPPTVSLVVNETNAASRTIPLVKSLADPVFGGSVSEVGGDLTYRLEYRGEKTRDFKVTVYEHPRLIRADADLTYPDYTKLPPKHIEDTRRISAVEGTKLDYALQLNKPVKSANFVARDGKKTKVPLTVSADKAVVTLPNVILAKSQTYDLQLVDAEGRANKTTTPFVIDVQPNRVPELRLNLPRGDVRPSALEEIAFEATVFDDFGAQAYGISYSMAGGESKFIEIGKGTAAKEKKTFSYMLKLEDIGAKPDDLISWHAWADDIGPDGKVRRTSSDLFFGEVRPFDEVFRESQGMDSDDQQKGGKQGGAQTRRLVELQKQVINATWRLQRDGPSPKYTEDAKVVSDSQAQALAQAEETMAEARSPRAQALWTTVTSEMKKAIEELNKASKSPAPLAQALPAEQAAYQGLLKLQGRETNVTRGKKGGGGGGGGQQNQRQIDQLDLTQAENRYETQRQAQAPTTKERTEQLQVMNRLQELSRRQQDLNDRLKELQAALQEAKTEQEREELKRRLKRLQEEQQQMLADVDEVRQRMDRPENQSRMADERKQLEQTRDDIQKAADAAAQGSVPQALASGTRAQRQLQQIREDIRKQNSSEFAEDMRTMRQEARDIANEQEKISQQLEGLNGPQQKKSLSSNVDQKDLIDQLAQQKERVNKFTQRAQQMSEQAETAEPLLSKQLEDSVRKLSQSDTDTVKNTKQELLRDGMLSRDMLDRLQKTADRESGGKTLDLAKDMLNEGFLPQASQAGTRAREATNELRRGVERAAESVLGDDTEQLKLAQSELDKLTDELTREMAQSEGKGQDGAPQPSGKPGQPGDRAQRQAGMQPGEAGQQGAGEPGGTEPGAEAGQEPGSNGQPGGKQGKQGERRVATKSGKQGQQGQAGQPGQEGQQPGQGNEPGQPGQGSQPGEQVASNNQPGPQPGQGQTPGQDGQPGQSGQQGQAGQGGQQGQQTASAGQPGQPGGKQGGNQRGQANRTANNQRGGNNQQGGGRGDGQFNIDDILNGAAGGGDGNERFSPTGEVGGMYRGGPFNGGDFRAWDGRLRDVEQLLDSPDLRNAVSTARERARLLRRDQQTERKKPDWAVVKAEIIKPLVEVRARLAEELSRRDSKDSLAPIDRDPVPTRFAESVRRYYEELGKDKPAEKPDSR